MNNHRTPAGTGPVRENADYWLDIFGDADFPAHRAVLWEHARGRGADVLTMSRLKDMPERLYKSMEDFRKAFGGALENYGNTH